MNRAVANLVCAIRRAIVLTWATQQRAQLTPNATLSAAMTAPANCQGLSSAQMLPMGLLVRSMRRVRVAVALIAPVLLTVSAALAKELGPNARQMSTVIVAVA